MPNILVTGGAGYIGSHIVLALLETGHKPVVLDDLSTGLREVVPAGIPFVQGNCGDEALAEKTLREHKVDAAIHCAGSISVEESGRDPLLYYANNTGNSRNLLAACLKAKVDKFLFSSTASLYGHPDAVPIPDTAELRVLNPYARSKAMTEAMLTDSAAAYGLHYVIMRYFNVAGADPAGRSGQVCPAITHLIRRALHVALGLIDRLEVYGTDWPTPDGTCLRDYVHVSDLATAHVLCLDYMLNGGANRILNCGYGKGFSVREVLRTIEEVTGKKLPTVEIPRRAGDPVRLIADAAWLRDELHWQPAHNDLPRIVTDALKWEEKRIAAGAFMLKA